MLSLSVDHAIDPVEISSFQQRTIRVTLMEDCNNAQPVSYEGFLDAVECNGDSRPFVLLKFRETDDVFLWEDKTCRGKRILFSARRGEFLQRIAQATIETV